MTRGILGVSDKLRVRTAAQRRAAVGCRPAVSPGRRGSSLRGLPVGRPVLSVLIPVYNEKETIRGVLDKVRRVPFGVETEIVVVDDGSTDGTTEILRSLKPSAEVRLCYHPDNRGKGAAVKTALDQARGDIVVIQDADDELEPVELLAMLECVSSGRWNVAYGSRFAGSNREHWFTPTYWANRVLNGLCNSLNGLRLTDMNTCYKMMRREVAQNLDLVSRGFRDGAGDHNQAGSAGRRDRGVSRQLSAARQEAGQEDPSVRPVAIHRCDVSLSVLPGTCRDRDRGIVLPHRVATPPCAFSS